MQLIEYMDRDFELLRKRIADVSHAYSHQDPSLTMDKAKVMFETFSRRFAIEDFLFSKFTPTAEMNVFIKTLLKNRRLLRERLEDMLMLHVSEPDFMKEIQTLLKLSEEHLKFLEQEFQPEVISKLPEADLLNMSNALEDRLHSTAFE
ncbi:MAG: hypothetical protein DKT66_23475 [Candidatus Melainabacteria bacterium]|nr:MAG: hypothetical protein DKT66_23475 [Candidatus Melainabacteria bacterium]